MFANEILFSSQEILSQIAMSDVMIASLMFTIWVMIFLRTVLAKLRTQYLVLCEFSSH